MSGSGYQKIRRTGYVFGAVIFFFILFFVRCSYKEEHVKNSREFIKTWNYDRALTEIISYRRAKDAEIQYLLGYCYLMKNEYSEAVTYFRNSLAVSEAFKDSIITLYNGRAKNALKINEPERALSFYRATAKLIPEHDQTDNLFLVGDMNFERGNYQAALEAYAKALEIDSASKKAIETKPKLIKALKECNHFDLALQLAAKQYDNLKIAANLLQLSEIRFALGRKLFDEGLIDSAKVFFEHIISQQEPKSLLDDAYFYVGEIYFKKEKFDAAREAYKKVLRLNPYEKGEIVRKAKDRIKELEEKI